MKLNRKINLPEWLTAAAAFVYYWIMALYKLTQAPIWQDEAMGFYCSVPVRGAIRGVTEYATMYERMAHIQQQPPLYNWLMCLWLQINEGEWWYRFSSVIFGFAAAVGFYVVLRRLCSRYAAAFGVVIYSSIFIIMYYIKESSEYSLLIMLLIWLIDIYFLMEEKTTPGRITAFVLLCIAAVFTHYGAVFVVAVFAVGVLIRLCRQRDWKNVKLCGFLYLLSAVAGGLPLVLLFIIPQSANQVSTLFAEQEIIIEYGSIFGDFINSLICVFRFFAIDIDRDWVKIGGLIRAAMVVIAIIMAYTLVKTKKKALQNFFWCNVASYLLYYSITKLNIYAYGWYGNRYNLFLFPFWFVLIVVSLYEFAVVIKESDKNRKVPLGKLADLYRIGLVLAGILYCVYGDYRISNHWAKMDLRAVVAAWYEREGYAVPTLLDFHQRYAFVYYFTHNGQYQETQWEKIAYNDELETYHAGNDTKQWKEYLDREYQGKIPQQLFVVTGQWNGLVDTFVELGYHVEAVVDTTAKLYYMEKNP